MIFEFEIYGIGKVFNVFPTLTNFILKILIIIIEIILEIKVALLIR